MSPSKKTPFRGYVVEKNFAFIFPIVAVNDSDMRPQSPNARNDAVRLKGAADDETTAVVVVVVDMAEMLTVVSAVTVVVVIEPD